MKKFFKFVFVIALAFCLLYAYNAHTNGELVQTIDKLTMVKETETTVPTTKSKSTVTLADTLNSALTDDEQKAFDIIYNGLSTHKSSVNIYQNIETDRIFELVELVLSQHPEIFWTKGDCTFSNSGRLTFKYAYSYEQAQEKALLIEKKADDILKTMDSKSSDYEKSLALFDYITMHTTYAYDEAADINNHCEVSTIEGVFLNGKAVCSGYSKAYQYLLTLCGMDAVTISGYANTPNGSENHAWTAQVIDNEIYFSDATWGDGFEKNKDSNSVSHIFFLMNSEELEKTHSCNDNFSAIKSTGENNYFVRQGLYFETYSQPDIRNRIKNAFEADENDIQLQFANPEEYKTAKENLFDNQGIYFILKTIDPLSKKIKTDTIKYSNDDEHNTITIFFSEKE